MSRETPEAAYEHAREAMRRQDLPEVFACLDVNDLRRIAENAINLSLGARIDDADPEVRGICRDHGFPLDDLLDARRQVMASPGLEATRRMRDTMKRGLGGVTRLAVFLGALERYTRRVAGGGSVSLRLFQDETLAALRVDGSRAVARRVFAAGSSDEVEFVRRKHEWFIKLFSRSGA
jgi:hypothetical protein